MKKLLMYVLGALFLFASCESDEMESETLVQANDVVMLKAIKSLKNYKSAKTSTMTSKSANANQVTRDFKMLYSRGTVGVFPNTDPYTDGPDSGCGDFGEPYLQFVVDGGGIASLIGKFSVINLACVDTDGNFVSPLLGWITAANGDVLYTQLEYVIPDLDHANFATYHYEIIGGSEGGRFENAFGYIEIYGDSSLENFEFVGGGEITY